MDTKRPPLGDQRRPQLAELQARGLRPLIDLMAESLVRGDDLGTALLAWIETDEGQAAMQGSMPELIAAVDRAIDRDAVIVWLENVDK